MKNQKCLWNIPRQLYDEFSLSDIPQVRHCGEFMEPMTRGCYSVYVCSPERPESGGLTLALVDYICPWGSGHQSKFFVFPGPVRILEFVPRLGKFFVPSILEVKFFPKEPLRDDESMIWISGRGFWVEECLEISHGSDWNEFVRRDDKERIRLLMQIHMRAVELYESVPSNHHWQFEWFPAGIYFEKPSFRH